MLDERHEECEKEITFYYRMSTPHDPPLWVFPLLFVLLALFFTLACAFVLGCMAIIIFTVALTIRLSLPLLYALVACCCGDEHPLCGHIIGYELRTWECHKRAREKALRRLEPAPRIRAAQDRMYGTGCEAETTTTTLDAVVSQ